MSGHSQPRSAPDRRRRRRLLFDLQKGRCFWCPADLSIETATLDELIPRSKGGTQRLGNVVVACQSCNYRRGAKLAPEWALKRAAEMVAAVTSGERG